MQLIRVTILMMVFTAVVPSASASAGQGEFVDPDISWWSHARKGANCQNETVEPEYWRAAAAAGIEFVRLAPDGWPSEQRDFLIGDADAFEVLVPADLEMVQRTLDAAHAAGVGVVLACVRPFPVEDLLAAEIESVVVASGAEVRFPVVYTNVSAEPVQVDLFLSAGAPAISPSQVFRDGLAVEPPPSCVLTELTLAEGRRAQPAPGGRLTMEARFIARPGGDSVWPGLASSCAGALPPGEYTLRVRAPARDSSRVDSVRLTVTR